TDLLNANRGQIRAMSMFFPAVGFTRAATSAALFVAGGFWILKGEMTIGTLLAFWQLVDRFFQPIGDLAEKYNIMQAAMASSERRAAACRAGAAGPIHLRWDGRLEHPAEQCGHHGPAGPRRRGIRERRQVHREAPPGLRHRRDRAWLHAVGRSEATSRVRARD